VIAQVAAGDAPSTETDGGISASRYRIYRELFAELGERRLY
jgi:hypothetical protein